MIYFISVAVVLFLMFDVNQPYSPVTTGGFSLCPLDIHMIIYDSQTIILAVIGLIGLLSTGVILTYAFRRNRTGNRRYQQVLTMHDPVLDPANFPGTPENEELRERRNYMREILLDLLQEQHDADHLQYPYRQSH